jgi:hypothetical protein
MDIRQRAGGEGYGMKEIDWSKAPTDATHYNQFACHWIKHLGNGSYQFLKGDEWEMGFGCMDSRYIERPEPEAWSGEGLPPAGTVCQLRTVRDPDAIFDGWGKAEIMYSSKSALVWRWQGHTSEFGAEWSDVEFRPIRTPEQVAAEERDEAIQEMLYLWKDSAGPGSFCAYLYDAGWRRMDER